jgi:hypothetical protein
MCKSVLISKIWSFGLFRKSIYNRKILYIKVARYGSSINN